MRELYVFGYDGTDDTGVQRSSMATTPNATLSVIASDGHRFRNVCFRQNERFEPACLHHIKAGKVARCIHNQGAARRPDIVLHGCQLLRNASLFRRASAFRK
jgi:hypothetical protein